MNQRRGITHEELTALLRYSPDGSLWWRKRINVNVAANTLAGSIHPRGYCYVSIKGFKYKASHLIWFLHNKTWPTNYIDHINGDKLDDRIENLRDVSQSVNVSNQRRTHKDNRVGLLGVTASKDGKFYTARIRIHGRNEYLGSFNTAHRAHEAYLEAKERMATASVQAKKETKQ